MILLNFSHPLTTEQTAQVEALTGHPLGRVISLSVQFDHQQPFEPQIDSLIRQIPLTAIEWQTTPVLVNLPSLNVIAALTLADLHGRMGYFPPVLRLRPVAGTLPPRFEVAEILNLQNRRDHARQTRRTED